MTMTMMTLMMMTTAPGLRLGGAMLRRPSRPSAMRCDTNTNDKDDDDDAADDEDGWRS